MKSSIQKRALITGITGQDGTYLAQLLLAKDYQVYGLIRGQNNPKKEATEKLLPAIELIEGDLTDMGSLVAALEYCQPDEVYNLGAISFVALSFKQPELTGEISGLGALRLLEAIRIIDSSAKKIRFYQASTSEMFGKVREIPQTELTAFYPRSPYGAAKAYAHYMTVNYRESYGLFACSGILFNHETVASFMPMFCKKSNEEMFDIKPICEIILFDETNKNYQGKSVSDISVWGKNEWVDVTYASAYPHDIAGDNKKPRFINSRSGAFMATSSHVAFLEEGREKEVGDIAVGDTLDIIDLPEPSPQLSNSITQEEAELLGMMVGDGSITYNKQGLGVHAKFTNSSPELQERFSYLWSQVTGGIIKYYPSKSGFNPLKTVGQLLLSGGNNWLRTVDIYNTDRTKRVPKVILNNEREIMLAFLRGYNATDGLKSNLCAYEFKNFKTNSPTLAMGLWYLIDKTTKQMINLTLETKADGRVFYSLNLLSTVDNLAKESHVKELVMAHVSQREIARKTEISRTFIRKIYNGGAAVVPHHLHKDSTEVKKIIEMPDYNGWFYDLETSSGEFHCGIGKAHVHNSPRRGHEFVTRKITSSVARIKLGLQKDIALGNLDSKRDWGFAGDYVQGMWLMLQQDKPEDYVLATGETHSIREFLDLAFQEVGISDWQPYVKQDPRFMRPAEVDTLIGNPTKAIQQLGWKTEVSFSELVKMMVENDLELESAKIKESK